MDEAHWLYNHTTKHDITTLQIEGVSSVQHVSVSNSDTTPAYVVT